MLHFLLDTYIYIFLKIRCYSTAEPASWLILFLFYRMFWRRLDLLYRKARTGLIQPKTLAQRYTIRNVQYCTTNLIHARTRSLWLSLWAAWSHLESSSCCRNWKPSVACVQDVQQLENRETSGTGKILPFTGKTDIPYVLTAWTFSDQQLFSLDRLTHCSEVRFVRNR